MAHNFSQRTLAYYEIIFGITLFTFFLTSNNYPETLLTQGFFFLLPVQYFEKHFTGAFNFKNIFKPVDNAFYHGIGATCTAGH